MMEDNAKLYSEIYQTMKLLIHVLIVNLLMEECQVENGNNISNYINFYYIF